MSDQNRPMPRGLNPTRRQAAEAVTRALAAGLAFSALMLAAGTTAPVEAATPAALEQSRAQLDQDNFEEAYALAKQAIAANPKSAEAHYLAGRAAQMLPDLKAAKGHLQDALKRDAKHRDSRMALAEVHNEFGERAEAEALIAGLAQDGPLPDRMVYLRALMQSEVGRDGEALAGFRGLRDKSPEYRQRAGYQIGLIEARRGDAAAARASFEQARAIAPRTGTGDSIALALEGLRTGARGFAAEITYRFESDSNVVIGPSGTVPGVISRQSDTRHVVTLDLAGSTPVGDSATLSGGYRFYQNFQSDLEEYDLQHHQGRLALALPLGRYTLQLPYQLDSYTVDGDDYLLSHKLTPTLVIPFGADRFLQPQVRLQKNNYRFATTAEENRDGKLYGAGLAFRQVFAGHATFLLTYEGGREDTDGANWENGFNRLEAALRYPFSDRFVARAYAEYLLQRYSNVHTAYGVKRDDDSVTVSVGGSYALTRKLHLHLDAAHVQQSSNIAAYDYDRTVYSGGASWRF